MGRRYTYGIRLEVDFNRKLLPMDASVIKPFCHKAVHVDKYDILRSDFHKLKRQFNYEEDTQSTKSPRCEYLKGKLHLFRSETKIDDEKYKAPEENLALLLGVPSQLRYEDFLTMNCIKKCAISDVYFIKEKKDSYYYCILAKLPTVKDSENFKQLMHNGVYHSQLRFGPVFLLHKVEYMNKSSVTSVPWKSYRVMPSCYLCLELLNADATDLFNKSCRHLYNNCHCNFSQCLLCRVWKSCATPKDDSFCRACKKPANLVCFICGLFFCGSLQAQEGHAFDHYRTAHHTYVFDIDTRIIYNYLENSSVIDRVLQNRPLITEESTLQRSLEATDVEADKEAVTAELAVHDNISPKAKQDVLRNVAVAEIKVTELLVPSEYNSVSTSNPGCEGDIVVHKEDDDAQRKAQEQNLILAVATAFRRQYYRYLPGLVAQDKKIAEWKDLEIELARVKKKELAKKISMKHEEAQTLRKKLEELKSRKKS